MGCTARTLSPCLTITTPSAKRCGEAAGPRNEPLPAMWTARQMSRLHQRKRDICRAVHIAGKGSFLGPAASPQRFADGVVIVKHGDSVRAVQPISFEANYQFLDGRPARMAELPTQ